MKLYVGTVRRAGSVRQGGELLAMDWPGRTVVRRVPIAPEDPCLDNDPNPRGNARGCRGIQVHNGELFVADYHTLRVYDSELNLRRKFSHGLMVGLHETCLDGHSLWVTSTAIDAVLQYDCGTGALIEAVFPRELPTFQRAWRTEPLPIDKAADCRCRFLQQPASAKRGHLHINAVAVRHQRRYVLANQRGAVAELSGQRVLVQSEALRGAHNLLFVDEDLLAINDTLGRTVRMFDCRSGRETHRIELVQFAWVRRLLRSCSPGWLRRSWARLRGRCLPAAVARPLFVRGLDVLGDELFVGVSPASILRINWRTGELLDAIQLSDDIRDCVHGLRVAA